MSKGTFEGIRLADFTWAAVGPIIARYLGDFGATVVHVETATHIDTIRTAPPFKDNLIDTNRSGYFALYNCNKYGLALNLNHPRGPEVARRLVAWADVLVESFIPGVVRRWGLGYEDVARIRPDIIYMSTCNQGQTGPHARHAGFGTQLSSLVGLSHITGWPDRGPDQPYAAFTDIVTPRFGLVALIAALDRRRKTGKGCYLDLSQFEAAVQYLGPLILDYQVNGRVANRCGNRSPCAAPHGAYRCRGEDRWCAIAVFSDQDWERFCQVLGQPEWGRDHRFATLLGRLEHQEELDRLVEGWTSERSAQEVMALMQEAGVAAGVVEDAEDILSDPQLQHRGHFWRFKHSEMGEHIANRPAFELSRMPAQPRLPSPLMGEHNEYVCRELLGMGEEDYVQLLLEGVFE